MYSGCLAQIKAPAPAPANEVPFPEVEAPLSALSAEAPALLDAPAPTVATVEAQVYTPFNACANSSIFNMQEKLLCAIVVATDLCKLSPLLVRLVHSTLCGSSFKTAAITAGLPAGSN